MQVTIPVLVTEHKEAGKPTPSAVVRPLFALEPSESGTGLRRALNKLGQELREKFENYAAEALHYTLAWVCFSPSFTTTTLRLRLIVSKQSFDCSYLFVLFDAFGKKLAYTPNVKGIWFELDRGEDLKTRAEDVLTEHFRDLERKQGKGTQNPSAHSFDSKAFVTTLDLNFNSPQKFEEKEENLFAMLGGTPKIDGGRELRNVGRCLELLYPEDLERAIGRDARLDELTRLLDSNDRRPVVLIGKSQVGKTNLINEYVFRKASKPKKHKADERLTFLLSPQRLISGMSYVGQWENRLTAILAEAKLRRHLLYFDDLLGLFFAGVSANSDLNVGQVLKPYLERRDVRVVAEVTPDAWRVLQEKDRDFAAQFRVFRLDETGDDETLKILLDVRRELEFKHRLEFSLEVIPTILDLQRRYNRDAAFPGKTASFLKQIGAKFENKAVTRDDVLREFEAKSGMNVAFLDDNAKLERAAIVRSIAHGVIGQKNAVDAAADAISVAKARLNDTNRPIASFLFLGATGVGKTEAAKQIAKYLYGSDEKLLRFDMNEYVSPYDVARLVGTFDQPEGLLTSAIRRQPFSVILLDEVEKAHPDVFNLLLQVLGDGRLTDAHGRTADFSNAIIILTSNLGAREANVKLGFRETNESNASVYRQAAEKFFRPEFFNRIDRIIPFENLSREDVGRIARLRLQSVFARDGFVQRNCRIELEPSALEKIIDEGYHPELGARALKRAIERNLTQPVAMRLAALKTNAPTIIRISREGDRFASEVEEIKPLAAAGGFWHVGDFADVQSELDKIEDILDEIENGVRHLKPHGEIVAADGNQKRYFLVIEHIKRIERMISRADRWSDAALRAKGTRAKPDKRNLAALASDELDFSDFLTAPNLATRIKRLAAESRAFGDSAADYVQDVWRETLLLKAIAANLSEPDGKTFVLAFRCADVYFGAKAIPALVKEYRRILDSELGFGCRDFTPSVADDYHQEFLLVDGAAAADVLAGETGNHVFVTRRGEFTPVEIDVVEIVAGRENGFAETYAERLSTARHSDFNVVRILDDRRRTLDFRTGLITRDELSFRELRTFILSGIATSGGVK